MFDVGDVVRLTAVNLDADSNPVDAAAVAVVVTQPDGTTAAGLPAPTHDGTGAYHLDVPTAQPGRHVARWVGTAPGAFAQVDAFNVWPVDPRFLISLADAKRSISRSEARSARDEDLRLYVASASAVVENIAGPLAMRQCTEVFDGGQSSLLLSNPVASSGVVTVTEAGSVTTSCVVNAAAGIVYAGSASAPRAFAPGRQNVSVSYPVGVQVVPSNLQLAVREEFRFLWQIGQQSMHPGMGDDDTETDYTPSGFAVPRRVIELCAGSTSLPGFA